jgi:DNA-binding transcriptional LysR family regulator
MTLDQLRMLVKIAETGSVLAAADALFRSQPTISVAIKKLEEELGVTLLSRDGYRASLTSEGKMLCQKAKAVLQQSEGFRDLAHHLATGNEPEVRIAIEASCPMPLILKIMRNSEQSFPNTEFSLMVENLWGAMERLQEGDAELAICPWLNEDLTVESFPFVRSHLLTVAAPDFIPLEKNTELALNDLQNLVQVVVKDSSRRARAESYGVLQQGRHWLVNDHYTKKELLLAGMGWGRLHRHLIERELQDGRLVPLNIRDYPVTLDIEMRVVRKIAESHGPVAEVLWQNFKAFAEL